MNNNSNYSHGSQSDESPKADVEHQLDFGEGDLEFKDLALLETIAKELARFPLEKYGQRIAYLFEAIEVEAGEFAGKAYKNDIMNYTFDILLKRIKQGEW